MNTAAATAWVEQNKKPLAIAGAVVVGGFGLMKARKGKAGGETPPRAAVVGDMGPARTGGGFAQSVPYDSSSSDVYNTLQPQLERLQQRLEEQQKSPIPVAVMAAGMDAPSFTGKYVTYADGSVQEVQSDGSLFHLSLPQYGDVQRRFGTVAPIPVAGNAPTEYSTTSNLQSLIRKANPPASA